jgi:hypothetical protein
MPVTMKEIDELRGEITELQRQIHRHTAEYGPGSGGFCTDCQARRAQIERVRACIEPRLREWWAQGCKEVEWPTFPMPGLMCTHGRGTTCGWCRKASPITRAEFEEWQEKVRDAFKSVGVKGL